MEPRKRYLLVVILGGILSAASRLCMLLYGVDDRGLPIFNHPATLAYLASGVGLLLVLLALSLKEAGQTEKAIVYSKGEYILSLLGVCEIVVGAVALLADAGTEKLLWAVLAGIAAGAMLFSARGRFRGKMLPPAELVPVIYLVLLLIVNFKSWSTDPIILDYCDLLFGLCFVVLAFYGSAGACFGQGSVRKTLFFSGAAAILSASSIVTSLIKGNLFEGLFYLGYILWLLPVIVCLQGAENAEPEK